MLKHLKKNWGYKLMALGSAIIVWILVMVYADPSITRTFSNIPITIINDSVITKAGKSYEAEGKLYASVKVTGPNSSVKALSVKDFSAVADISKLYEVTGQVPVEISCSANTIMSSQLTPVTTSIRIKLEDVLTKLFTVNVNYLGDLPEDYVLGDVKLKPETITVKAPESVIERIARAAVDISLDNLTEDTSQTAEIRYYSEGGSVLDLTNSRDTVFSNTEITADLEILNVKTVPVVLSIGGMNELPAGYRYTGASQSVNSVTLAGLKSRLAGVSSVTIPESALSVAGATGMTSYTLNLNDYLPEGVTLGKDQSEELLVELYVEALSNKTVDVLSVLQLTGHNQEYQYKIKNTTLNLMMKALEDDFDRLDIQALGITLNVSGLGPGDYLLTPELSVDSVFEVLSIETVKLLVEEIPPETEAPELPTEEEPSSEAETTEEESSAQEETTEEPVPETTGEEGDLSTEAETAEEETSAVSTEAEGTEATDTGSEAEPGAEPEPGTDEANADKEEEI